MAFSYLHYVLSARKEAVNGNLFEAFKMYIHAVSIAPRIKSEIQHEFRQGFLKIIDEVLQPILGSLNLMFGYFRIAMQIYPGHVDLLNDIGTFLYRHEYIAEALLHFEKAVNIDSSHVIAEKNLNNAKSILFPSRNFQTLNDKVRNEAYRAAIRSCINPATDNVIDIDSGSGLLAVYAQEYNPVKVSVYEFSNKMVQPIKCLMQEKHSSDVARVTKLKRNQVGTRSLLITGMFDAGLFGDYILQSLCQPWDNVLHDNNTIIPGRAEFFVAAVNCDELSRKYKLDRHIKNVLNIPHHNVHTTTIYAETYYGDDVHLYKNVKYICEPQSLFTIDFNNRVEVTEMLSRQRPYNAILHPTVDDEMNMVIGWFNLHLTEDIMLTSDPRAENRPTSWQQAVFFDVLSRKVRQNESIDIPFVPYGGRLTTLGEPGQPISRVSPEILGFLNDIEYMTMITKSIKNVCVHLQQIVDIGDVDIVDLSPFPVFGILMMRRGAHSLICQMKPGMSETFLYTVLQANGIPRDKVTVLDSDYWCREVFKDKQFHVIFGHIFEFHGDIDARKKRILHYLKTSHLIPNGIYLPASVTVMGQLVNSRDLESRNSVLDDNDHYPLSLYLNQHQVSQLSYLDVARLECNYLSEPFEIATIEDMQSKLVQVPILKDGACSAILLWYKVELLDCWYVTSTNRSNSFILSTAYMINPVRKLFKDDEVNVILCVSCDGCFKLALDN